MNSQPLYEVRRLTGPGAVHRPGRALDQVQALP